MVVHDLGFSQFEQSDLTLDVEPVSNSKKNKGGRTSFEVFSEISRRECSSTRKFLIPIKYRNCNFFSVS